MRDQLGGLLGDPYAPGYGGAFRQQYSDRNPRPASWDKDAELAKAKAANDAQTGLLGWTTDRLRSLGLPEGTLSNLNSAAAFAPVISDILDIETAGEDIGKAYDEPTWGNVGGAGLAAAMAAAGLIPGAGEAIGLLGSVGKRAPAAKPGIRAYHGSPHSFDKFDLKYMGTGEGAQAYGKGHYFAGEEAVAKGYRDSLKSKNYDNNALYSEAVKNHGFGAKEFDQFEAIARTTIPDPDLLAREFFSWNPEWRKLADDPVEYKNVRDFAQKYIDGTPKGSMYEANINVDPEDMLDWDKPLEGQRAFDRLKVYWDDKVGDPDIILERMGIDPKTATGGDLMQIGFDVDAGSALMKDVGVPGVKYLDGGSRAAGEGTSNYVVFDDALIEILKKYGLSGLLAGGGATYLATADREDPQSGLLAPDL